MIMVIGGRCQGKSSFAKEHFENRVQEKGKTQEDHQKQGMATAAHLQCPQCRQESVEPSKHLNHE